jgi:hypothetical protein
MNDNPVKAMSELDAVDRVNRALNSAYSVLALIATTVEAVPRDETLRLTQGEFFGTLMMLTGLLDDVKEGVSAIDTFRMARLRAQP